MTIFKDSHHFSRTLGSLWWQSLMTVFNDNAFLERTLRGRFREQKFNCFFVCTAHCLLLRLTIWMHCLHRGRLYAGSCGHGLQIQGYNFPLSELQCFHASWHAPSHSKAMAIQGSWWKGIVTNSRATSSLTKLKQWWAFAFALAQHSDSVPEEKKALVIGRLMTRVILHLLGKESKGQEKTTFQSLEEINNKFGVEWQSLSTTGALGTAPSSSGSKAEKEAKPVALQEPCKTLVHLSISHSKACRARPLCCQHWPTLCKGCFQEARAAPGPYWHCANHSCCKSHSKSLCGGCIWNQKRQGCLWHTAWVNLKQ